MTRPGRLARLAAVAALVVAAACADGHRADTTVLGELVGAARSVIAGPRAAAGAPGALPAGLSRAAIAGETAPMLLANVDSLGVAATLRQARTNGDFVTWASADRTTLILRGGILTASRGLGGDLLAGDAAPVLAAFTGGPRTFDRDLRLFGGDREIVLSHLSCRVQDLGAETVEVLEVAHPARHFAETCTDAAGGSLRNDYWRGADGTMWKSRQFLSPSLGYITLQVLIR